MRRRDSEIAPAPPQLSVCGHGCPIYGTGDSHCWLSARALGEQQVRWWTFGYPRHAPFGGGERRPHRAKSPRGTSFRNHLAEIRPACGPEPAAAHSSPSRGSLYPTLARTSCARALELWAGHVGPELAHRDILRCRPKSVAIGAKQTLLSHLTSPGLWVHGLALLWQNVFWPLFFKDLLSAIWALLRRRPKDEIDDGMAYGGHGWLRRRPVDSFFSAPRMRGDDVAGRRRQSLS